MSIRPMAIISTVGAGIGGAVAMAVGGPACIAHGIKIGLGFGIQVAVVNKAEQTADKIGQKIETAADKAMAELYLAQKRMTDSIENVAHTWSILMLSGYAIQIALNGVNQSVLNYNTSCKSSFENLNCASMSLTTVSFNIIAISSGLCLGYKVFKMLTERRTECKQQVLSTEKQ